LGISNKPIHIKLWQPKKPPLILLFLLFFSIAFSQITISAGTTIVGDSLIYKNPENTKILIADKSIHISDDAIVTGLNNLSFTPFLQSGLPSKKTSCKHISKIPPKKLISLKTKLKRSEELYLKKLKNRHADVDNSLYSNNGPGQIFGNYISKHDKFFSPTKDESLKYFLPLIKTISLLEFWDNILRKSCANNCCLIKTFINNSGSRAPPI